MKRPRHTKTPWHLETLEEDGKSLAICKANIGVLALINPEDGPESEDRANADFIIRAVNNFESLLDALSLADRVLREKGLKYGYFKKTIANAKRKK